MELTWWPVIIVACLALAAGIVVVMVAPGRDHRRRLPLANVGRLTSLPAYVRAARRRTVLVLATMALLAVAAVATVLTAARPTGLPATARDATTGQPEDVMVCVAGPLDDPRIRAGMSYFAGHAQTLDTQRIGLTSANRRVVPMTRDHQFASARFGEFAAADARQSDFTPAVAYANYARRVEDVLALCLTGFPGFDEIGAQRRSVIYLGPGALPGDTAGAGVVDGARLRSLAESAGAQVNVLLTDPPNPTLADLARATGGRTEPLGSDVAARLAEIRATPPPSTSAVGPTVRAATPETPDVPLLVALGAVAVLSALPLWVRR